MKKIGFILVSVLMLLSSCDSYTASGAMTGGLLGSAIGGITGGPRGSDVGTLIGAAIGATAGAAARDAEIRRSEAAYYDDMYRGYDDPKAQRVARYHARTKAKHSARYRGRSYSTDRGSQSRSGGVYGNYGGFSLESADGDKYSQGNSQPDESGRSDDAKYDDRIEMK